MTTANEPGVGEAAPLSRRQLRELERRRALEESGQDPDAPDAVEVAAAPAAPVASQPVVLHPYERGAARAGSRPSTIVALDHEPTYWNLHGTDKVEGKVQNAVGSAKDSVRDAARDTKRDF